MKLRQAKKILNRCQFLNIQCIFPLIVTLTYIDLNNIYKPTTLTKAKTFIKRLKV